MMKNKALVFWLLIVSGLLCLGNGLRYFIGGEAERNSDLRNYAVIGQIIFALAVVAYGAWLLKKSGQYK